MSKRAQPQLEEVINFDGKGTEHWDLPNLLVADEKDRLFFRYTKTGRTLPATPKAALEWYVRCVPFSDSWSGPVERLFAIAARHLPA